MTKQPSSDDVMMYGCLVGESDREARGMLSPAVDADASEPCVMVGADESAGKEEALVAGCNANNGMASARTANCNNAVSNDNSKHLYVTNNGSFEIKEFFKLVAAGSVCLPVKTKVCSQGKSFYFEGFHTTSEEACELLCEKFGI